MLPSRVQIVTRIDRVLGATITAGVAVAVGFVILSTVYGVFLRYVLNKSAVGIIEINTLLLPPVVFLLLAETQRRRGHVRVTLLTMRLSSRVQSVIETYGFVLGLAFMVVFGWQTWKEFTYSYGINQVLYGIMPIPVWWSKLCLPIACWLLCLQYVKDLVSNIGQLRLKE